MNFNTDIKHVLYCTIHYIMFAFLNFIQNTIFSIRIPIKRSSVSANKPSHIVVSTDVYHYVCIKTINNFEDQILNFITIFKGKELWNVFLLLSHFLYEREFYFLFCKSNH